MDIQTLLIPGEDPAKLQHLADLLTSTWQPANFKEEIFLNQLIHHNWQIERFRILESQMWAKAAAAGCADSDDVYAKTEKRVAGLHRLVASVERCISRAVRDIERLQAARLRQSSRPPAPQIPKQTQFEAEIASWPEPEEEKQTQFEYPPVPQGANEGQFPTDHMRRLADWRLHTRKK